MAETTGISWCDATFNPVTGCTKVSPGCARCYITSTPPFRIEGRRFDASGSTGVRLHPDRLDQPLRWRRPRLVFVNSLSDLFHEDVPDDYLRTVFAVMASAREHTFQVLTKRPERMRDFLAAHHWRAGMLFWATPSGRNDLLHTFLVPNDLDEDPGGIVLDDGWTPPNVWLGVSIENARYTWRADVLREIPAAVRFISAEPLLGSLFTVPRIAPSAAAPAKRGYAPLDLSGIDWIIVGGESGPGARPFHLEHAREIIAAARARDVVCCQSPPAECCGRYLPTGECCAQPVPADGCCGDFEQIGPGPAVFVKQLGAKPIGGDPEGTRYYLDLRDRKGGDIAEFPVDLRIREFPRSAA